MDAAEVDDPAGQHSGSLTLDPIGSAVAAARRYVRQRLAELGREDIVDSSCLGVSELVTNAAIHARTSITVDVAPTAEGTVRVSVRDRSSAIPMQRHYGLGATTGRGLHLVEAASSEWGVTPEADGGKTIWFEPIEAIADTEFAAFEWLADVEGLQ